MVKDFTNRRVAERYRKDMLDVALVRNVDLVIVPQWTRDLMRRNAR